MYHIVTAATTPKQVQASDVYPVPVYIAAAPGVATTVIGSVAHDAAAASVAPVLMGGYASAAAPTSVNADGDAVDAWFLRNGAQVVNLSSGGTLILVGSGTSTGALRVELPTNGTGVIAGVTTVTTLTGGGVAHDGVDSGNPVKVGGKAYAPDSGPTDVASGDRADLFTDLKGRPVVYIATTLDSTNDAIRAYADGIVIRPTITTSAAAYTAGDCIGGIITLSSAAFASAAPVKLRSIVLKDDINQKPSLQLLFFRSSPAGTYTDNSAVAPTTADMGALIHIQTVAAADWVSIQGVTKAAVSYELDDGPILGSSDANIYMVIVAGATPPDYNANSTDLTAEIGFERMV